MMINWIKKKNIKSNLWNFKIKKFNMKILLGVYFEILEDL